MSDIIEREYPYRVNLYLLWAAPLLSGFMCGFAVYFGMTNSEPVYLQGVMEIPVVLANIAAWFGCVLFACFFAASVVFALQALTHKQRIAISEKALLVPKGFWSSADQTIPYCDITELVPHAEPDQSQSLIVHHAKGKFPISESLLPSKQAFQELWRLLADRVADNRTHDRNPR